MKPQTNYYREAVDKVAHALDEVILAVLNESGDMDGILACCAEMRGYIVQAMEMANAVVIDIPNDQPRVYADEVFKPGDTPRQFTDTPKPGKLPKLKPQGHKSDKPKYKPGIAQQFRGALTFRCPRCMAEENTNCFKFDGPGAHPQLTDERNDGTFFHRQRQDLAKQYNDRIRKANILP
jgi:hypothetical protein